MSERTDKKPPSEAHNRHHAGKRRLRRETSHGAKAGKTDKAQNDGLPAIPGHHVLLYGLHTVRHALANASRIKHALFVTRNGLARLQAEPAWLENLKIEEVEPRLLDRLLGADAVHQGAVLHCQILESTSLKAVSQSALLLVLDQVTDPHNVGAIMRSAVAMGAGALISTNRHSPIESGVLAKAASGALDMIEHVGVRNLAECLKELASLGYQTVGLDSDGPQILEQSLCGQKIALVLGAEGKGLRQKTRETCNTLARIDLPGAITSLNVSNASALSLYIAHKHLARI